MGLRKCGCEGEEGLTEDLVFPRVSPEPRPLIFLQVPFQNLMCVRPPDIFLYVKGGSAPASVIPKCTEASSEIF